MLNIMLNYYRHQDFIGFLRSFHPKAINSENQTRNLNLGPNIVSLIQSKQEEYPYAATLIGDSEFPFDRIIANEQVD
jgi:hypothetical protein